eukprot:TRINITY_DN16210_c0_g2_i5.p2 TRINITY_DN16210_c0_g2~~TRINITY_DN16210_c0_g2_i5.p2  ORF type:complete len:131 (+),score=15.10 TRINITY_DN16210_c0_g2_i5:90-482(+)
MIRRPPRSTQGVSSAASDVYKRQLAQYSVVNKRCSEKSKQQSHKDECQYHDGGQIVIFGVSVIQVILNFSYSHNTCQQDENEAHRCKAPPHYSIEGFVSEAGPETAEEDEKSACGPNFDSAQQVPEVHFF